MRLFRPRYPVLKRVIVNMKTETAPAMRGVLFEQRGGYLVLKQAEMLQPRAEPVRVDGDVLIPQENVLFLQVVG